MSYHVLIKPKHNADNLAIILDAKITLLQRHCVGTFTVHPPVVLKGSEIHNL